MRELASPRLAGAAAAGRGRSRRRTPSRATARRRATPEPKTSTTFSWCTAACSAASRSNIVRPSGSRHEVRQQALDDELAAAAPAASIGSRDVHLGRAADGEARVEPVRPELDRARPMSGRGTPRAAEGFRPTTCRGECIYAGPSTHKMHGGLRPAHTRRPRSSPGDACSAAHCGIWRRARGAGRRRRRSPRRRAGPTSGRPRCASTCVTDLAGALEPCGCTKDQLGGLDHFGAWVDRASAARAGGARRLGGARSSSWTRQLGAERADQDRIKAETIARVLHDLGLRRVRARRQRLGRRRPTGWQSSRPLPRRPRIVADGRRGAVAVVRR